MAMPQSQIQYVKESPEHSGAIDALLNLAFGPGRFAKAAERLREGNHPIGDMCFVAVDHGAIVASVRFWPIEIGGDDALLLGPLAVDPARRGAGIGIKLMEKTLEVGRQLGHGTVILVGDEPYYARLGFATAKRGSISFPGPVDPLRILWCDLTGAAKQTIRGKVSVPRDTSS